MAHLCTSARKVFTVWLAHVRKLLTELSPNHILVKVGMQLIDSEMQGGYLPNFIVHEQLSRR